MADKLNFINHKINKTHKSAPSPFSNHQKERTKTVRLRYSLYHKIKIKGAIHNESITDILEKAVKYAERHHVI